MPPVSPVMNLNETQNNNGGSSDDPYFLHHSDNPGATLVTQVLTGDNYASWSRSMTIALSVKNKLEFVTGEISKPAITDSSFKSWNRNNNMVISWILNSISKEISASVIYLTTASSMWKELKERFQQSNGPRVFQIKRDLMNTVQGDDSVSTYFTKLKVIWEELLNFNAHCTCGLCTCGGAKETEQTMSFLMGLNDKYAQIRGQILLMDPLPSVNKIFSLVIQEERQREISNPLIQNTPVAFNVQNNYNSNNNQKNRSNNQNKNRSSVVCTHCRKTGHTIEKCYKLHGFPPGYRFNQNQNQTSRINSVATNDSSENNTEANPITTLTNQQCQQLIAVLTGQLASTTSVNSISVNTEDYEQEADWHC